jgi:hypothetical protein
MANHHRRKPGQRPRIPPTKKKHQLIRPPHTWDWERIKLVLAVLASVAQIAATLRGN